MRWRGCRALLAAAGAEPTSTASAVRFHGGGGSRQSANKSTCPGGDEDSPECLVKKAAAHSYAVHAGDMPVQGSVGMLGTALMRDF